VSGHAQAKAEVVRSLFVGFYNFSDKPIRRNNRSFQESPTLGANRAQFFADYRFGDGVDLRHVEERQVLQAIRAVEQDLAFADGLRGAFCRAIDYGDAVQVVRVNNLLGRKEDCRMLILVFGTDAHFHDVPLLEVFYGHGVPSG